MCKISFLAQRNTFLTSELQNAFMLFEAIMFVVIC